MEGNKLETASQHVSNPLGTTLTLGYGAEGEDDIMNRIEHYPG